MGKPFIHESAYVDDGAQIGADTKVWHFCHVLGGAVIGERCSPFITTTFWPSEQRSPMTAPPRT